MIDLFYNQTLYNFFERDICQMAAFFFIDIINIISLSLSLSRFHAHQSREWTSTGEKELKKREREKERERREETHDGTLFIEARARRAKGEPRQQRNEPRKETVQRFERTSSWF